MNIIIICDVLLVTCAHDKTCYQWRVNFHVTQVVCCWKFMLPLQVLMNIHIRVMCTHNYACILYVYSPIFNVTHDIILMIFMLPVTCRPTVTLLMNINVTRDVYSSILMLPVTCTREHSCYPWCILVNIHVNSDVYSWIFMLPVTCTHEYSCYPWYSHEYPCYSWHKYYPVTCTHKYSCFLWRVLMNIHVSCDVYSWIFMFPVTCTHEYSCFLWRVLMNIHV